MFTTLNNLPLGTSAKIMHIDCNPNIQRRFLDLGFIKNTNITLKEETPAIQDKIITTVINEEDTVDSEIVINYIIPNADIKEENDIEQIYLCGFDTDACVQKTALDLFENNYDVYVLKDYCMTTSIELHNVIIDNLRCLIGRNSII